MKKTINRLPDSELDIMLVLWKYEPPMTRIEIERVVNEKKCAGEAVRQFSEEICGFFVPGQKNESG